jgi:hypothetical protein
MCRDVLSKGAKPKATAVLIGSTSRALQRDRCCLVSGPFTLHRNIECRRSVFCSDIRPCLSANGAALDDGIYLAIHSGWLLLYIERCS